MLDEDKIMLFFTMLLVLVLALGINYYFYKKQEEYERRRLKSKQLQKQIKETLETLSVLKQTGCDPRIITALNDYSLSLFKRLLQISPNPTAVDQLEKSRGQSQTLPINLKGNSGIKLAQHAIRATRTLCNRMRQEGVLPLPAYVEFSNELNWLHGTIEADAHISQAQKLAENKKTVALAHCKQARMAVNKIPGREPRKQDKIKEISELVKKLEQPKMPVSTVPVEPEKSQNARSA